MTTTIASLTSDTFSDGDALMDHLVRGKPLDEDVARRIRERAAEVTERLRTTQGVRDIAVDLVRQCRDEV